MSNQPAATLAAPVSQGERIVLLDSLRGLALLGILLMNIPYMGLPEPSFDNPTLNYEMGTINEKVWWYVNWIPESMVVCELDTRRNYEGHILHAFWSRHHVICFPPGKKNRRSVAGRIFYTTPVVVARLRTGQRIYSLMAG